jgi:hypothetical protein
MALLVDDLVALPGTFFKVILNTLAQTVQKLAWTEYSTELRKMLLRARNDYDHKKITKEKFQEVEQYVFSEMKIAKKIISGK